MITGKPTYEELEQRIKELEKEASERKQVEEASNRLASIVEFSDDAIISKTLDGIIVSWNKAAEKIYGYSEKEVQGKSISILCPPSLPSEVPKILNRIKRGKYVDRYETIRQRKDGSLIDASITISSLKDNKGRIIGASTIARDISERKRTEKAIREGEKRFRNLVENSLTGISIIQDNQIVYQNSEQEKLLGPLPRVAILADIESIHPDDVENVKEFHQQVITGDIKTTDIDFRFYPMEKKESKTGMKWVYCRTSAIKYRGKDAILVNIMDMTKAKELEHLLRIQDKMTSLGRVTAGIAHEIRNPLSGINIYLNTLEKIYDKTESLDKVKQILKKLQSASRKIESVIRRVMDFSKPSEPKLILADLNKPIEAAISLSTVTLRKSGIKIEKALAENLPKCRLDPHLIEEVILNLIYNAAEAMKNVDSTKIIRISSSKENSTICVSISDSGLGVPLELRDKIFDPFYTTKNGNTGIGLSLSYRVITDHGGSLDVSKSKLGGAEFILKIPIKKGTDEK